MSLSIQTFLQLPVEHLYTNPSSSSKASQNSGTLVLFLRDYGDTAPSSATYTIHHIFGDLVGCCSVGYFNEDGLFGWS